MLGLWQSTVLCEEMLFGEMCWTLQVEDDVIEDNVRATALEGA